MERLFLAGYESHEEMIMEMLAEDMGMTVAQLSEYSNPETDCYGNRTAHMKISQILDVYLYEATAFGKKGRVCEFPVGEYYNPGSLSFSQWSFILGVEELYF